MKLFSWMSDAQFDVFMDVVLTFALLCIVHTVTLLVEEVWGEPGLGRFMGVFYRRVFRINMDVVGPVVTAVLIVTAVLYRLGFFGEG